MQFFLCHTEHWQNVWLNLYLETYSHCAVNISSQTPQLRNPLRAEEVYTVCICGFSYTEEELKWLFMG